MDYYFNIILSAAPTSLLALILAYLIGSISTAIITCKIMGIEDPRQTGSKNPGATNVLRHGGKKAAIITLIGDALKGLIPVLLAIQFQLDVFIVALVGLCALLGHIFPLYYAFKGGKGVATFYGVILGVNWLAGVIALTIWLVIASTLKISSLSALISVFSTPILIWYFSQSTELTVVIALMSLVVFWRHKKNIQALLQGSETKIGKN